MRRLPFLALLVISLGDPAASERTPIRGALLSVGQSAGSDLSVLNKQGYEAVVLAVDPASAPESVAKQTARIRKSWMGLYYWIEVGRCPELADKHPAWMASLQGHSEWRRLFPALRATTDGEVVKAYPWVPVAYKEAFSAHLERIRALLKRLPAPDGVFLNDLQAGPSACGCGNPLCRWTTDYGPVRTATAMGSDSAARFVESVRKIAPRSEIIPVWLTECQEHETHTACAGVSCFTGACWKDFTQQVMPLVTADMFTLRSPRLGALVTHRVFGQPESWISSALKSFQNMPPKRGGSQITQERLIPVLQGWDSSPGDRRRLIELARKAGARDYVVALTPIVQSWEPRIVQFRGSSPAPQDKLRSATDSSQQAGAFR